MAVYQFKGVTTSGKSVSGIRNADSARTLQGILRKEGIFPTEISEHGKAQRSREVNLKHLRGSVSARDLSVVTRQLATLLRAGVTLVESLSAVIDQTENSTLKLVLSQVKQKVNEGTSLADAMAVHPKAFPELYCNMVRAGESSGALDIVLQRLADFTESQAQLRSKIIGTMTYPAIMIMVGLVIISILMVVVIPKITKIFADRNATLPLPTKVLLTVANFTREWWWAIILALVQFGVGGALGVMAIYLAVNFVIGNYIEPKLMGKGLGLSVLVVFLSLIFWGWLLGPVGMFLSIPITLVFKIIMQINPNTRWIAVLLGDANDLEPQMDTDYEIRR